MGTFRGLICQNEKDYRNKERLIHNALKKFGNYTSDYFSGGRGVADLYDVNGKPILVEPKHQVWINEIPKLPLNFQDLDISVIKVEE